MNKLFTLSFVIFLSSQLTAQTVIARWDFEDFTASNTAATTPTLTAGTVVADSGNLVSGSAFSAVHASASTVWSTPSGNGSAKAISSNNWGVGDYYQFKASSIGYTNGISIKFDQNGSGTGPASFMIQYSTDGTSYTNGVTYTIPNNGATPAAAFTWTPGSPITTTTFTFDLTSVATLKNASNVYFRIVDNATTSVNGGTVGTGGTGRIDNFYIYDGETPVPVKLTSFTAISNTTGVQLQWKTAQEINTKEFTVEKSIDGANFTSISKTTATGNSSISRNYQTIDNTPSAGVSYYRLATTDLDGNISYSTIIKVNYNGIISIFPNPVRDEFTISHPASVRASLTISDMQGKRINLLNITGGSTSTKVSVNALSKGQYIIKYIDNGHTIVKALIKQ